MAKFVLLNTRLFTGLADLTTLNNKVEVKASVEDKETTAFAATGDVWAECLAGLRSTEISAEGQWDADDTALGKPDDVSYNALATITPWSICPATAAVSSLAYFTGALRTGYSLGGQVGEVVPWSADAKGNWPLVRGVVAHDPGTSRSATGTGTSIQLGAVSASQQLYAALHVLSVSGSPTLTVKVQSDNATGFPSSADQITFTAATGKTSEIKRVAGAITDDWFRAAWTITGTGSVLFLVAFGIA